MASTTVTLTTATGDIQRGDILSVDGVKHVVVNLDGFTMTIRNASRWDRFKEWFRWRKNSVWYPLMAVIDDATH